MSRKQGICKYNVTQNDKAHPIYAKMRLQSTINNICIINYWKKDRLNKLFSVNLWKTSIAQKKRQFDISLLTRLTSTKPKLTNDSKDTVFNNCPF